MLRLIATSGAYTENANIPFTVSDSTNSKAVLNSDNTISLNTTGIKDIKASIVFTPTNSGNITLTTYANGVAIDGSLYTITATASNTYTLTINDIVKIIPSTYGNIAKLSFSIDEPGTINGGNAVIEHVS